MNIKVTGIRTAPSFSDERPIMVSVDVNGVNIDVPLDAERTAAVFAAAETVAIEELQERRLIPLIPMTGTMAIVA